MASEKTTAILDAIKGLTILELADLVKEIEAEFGVSAAVSVANPKCHAPHSSCGCGCSPRHPYRDGSDSACRPTGRLEQVPTSTRH